MKTLTLMAVVLATGTLGAQSPAGQAEKRVQIFGEFSRPKQFTLAQPNGDVKDQADSQLGVGVRFLGELPGTNNWFFEFGGKFESSSKLGFNRSVPMASGPAISINSTDVSVKYSYWEVGGAYLWNFGGGLSLGAHLDLRSETLSANGQFVVTNYTGSGPVDQRMSFVRPWLRLSGDFAFKPTGFTPYIGIDAAFTPIKNTQNAVVPATLLDERTLKAMAPQFTASVYLGLRF